MKALLLKPLLDWAARLERPRLLALTAARCDEDHLPVLLLSDPRIPRRPAAILDGGESPLPRLRSCDSRPTCSRGSRRSSACPTPHAGC